jgi:hypothetical protein
MFTPGNAIDVGQTTTINALISTGVPPYNGVWAWMGTNVLTLANTIIQPLPSTNELALTVNAVSTNSLVLTFNGVSYDANGIGTTNTVFGLWTLTGNAIDSTGANSVQFTNTFTISNTLSVNPISNPPAEIDMAQRFALTETWTGGTPTYESDTYLSTATSACTTGSSLAGVHSGLIGYSDTNYFLGSGLTSTPGSFHFCGAIVDSASTPVTALSATSTNVLIANTPSGSAITPLTNTLDVGQNVIISTTISNGIGPFTANLVYANNDIVANTITGIALGGTANLNFVPATANTYTVNIVITDTGTSTPYVFNAPDNSVISVNPALSFSPNPPTLSNTIIDVGQLSVLHTAFSGGTGPDYYSHCVLSQMSGNAIPQTACGVIFSSGPGPVDTTITALSDNSLSIALYGGTSYAFTGMNTVFGTWSFSTRIKDSASSPGTVTSLANTLMVHPAPTAISLTPSATTLNSGQYVTYNVIVNGGALPITANLVLVSNSIPIQINGNNANPGTTYGTTVLSSGNVITFNQLELSTSGTSSGDAVFTVNAVDSASTPVTFNTVANTIIINAVQNSGGGGGGGSGGCTLCGSGGSGVWGGGSSTTTTTTTTTTTSTTTIPVIDIGSSERSFNSTFNISSGSPMEFNFSNMDMLIVIMSSNQSSQGASIFVANLSGEALPANAPANMTKVLSLVNASIKTNANVTINMTIRYPCAMNTYANIAPFKLKDGTWVKLADYDVNRSSCTVSLTLPNKDPIIAVFGEYSPATNSSTTISTAPSTSTTAAASNKTAASAPASANSGASEAEGVVAVIVVIAIIAYLVFGRKKR